MTNITAAICSSLRSWNPGAPLSISNLSWIFSYVVLVSADTANTSWKSPCPLNPMCPLKYVLNREQKFSFFIFRSGFSDIWINCNRIIEVLLCSPFIFIRNWHVEYVPSREADDAIPSQPVPPVYGARGSIILSTRAYQWVLPAATRIQSTSWPITIILQSTPRSTEWNLPFNFPYYYVICGSQSIKPWHICSQSHSPSYKHPKNT
jgi:hypothetical protein